MDFRTHRRGPADTDRAQSISRSWKVVTLSLLLHLPFTPWAALLGLMNLWSPAVDDSPSPDITGIPVDLIDDSPEPAPVTPPANPPATGALATSDPPASLPPKKTIEPRESLDAGPYDAGSDGGPSDAGLVDAGANDAGLVDAAADASARDAINALPPDPKGVDAGPSPDAGVPADAGARPLADPTLVASVKQVADPNANVRISIYTDKIRQSPLGVRVGPLLRSLYQWRDFFGPTAIDPIRDIDQMYVVGSQLRDSSNVVAILRHHLPPSRMRAAVDALVRADQDGTWLDAGFPAASAHADGSERRFIFPNPETVVVTPVSAYKSVLSVGKQLRLTPSKGAEVALIYLATPWRAFLGFPIKVPKTIKWARVRVTPSADGGATAEIDAEDADEATAEEDAAYLTRTANALSQLNLGFLGSLLGQPSHRFVEHVAFAAQGTRIRGEAVVTADQLSMALDMASALLADRASRRAPKKSAPLSPP